jgi:DNA-binding CsgD family transcriptional regulator
MWSTSSTKARDPTSPIVSDDEAPGLPRCFDNQRSLEKPAKSVLPLVAVTIPPGLPVQMRTVTINPPPPPNQAPRDTELLEELAQARARGDSEAERAITGRLLAGWIPRVESLARFRGLEPYQVGDVVGGWGVRMVKALAKQTSFNGPFGAVAMQNAGWACTDEHRAARGRDQLAAEPLAVDPDDPSRAGDDVPDVLAAVDAVIARLSEREQAIIDGVIRGGRPHKEIAAELGMSEGAAKTALCRALSKVRTQLREAGVTNRGRPPV